MKHDHLCENYLACWDREMALPEDERCPHLGPQEKRGDGNYRGGINKNRIERILNEGSICREIILKENEWKVLVIGYPTIARLIHGETVDLESHKICLIPDDQLFNEHQRITSDHLKEGK